MKSDTKEEPKSHLFSKVDLTRDEDFAKDIAVLAALEDNVLESLPEHAVHAWLAPSGRETEKVYDIASRELGVPRAQLDHTLKVSQFLIQSFLKKGEGKDDQPEDIVSDLEHIYDLTPERHSSMLAFVERLQKLTRERVEPEARRKRYAQSSLPVLESIATTANYRLVYDEDFKVDTDISSFKPKCLGLIPVGIIELGFDSGPTGEVFFLADRRAIRLLIDHLKGLEKQLDAAREHFQGGEN